MKKLTNYLTVRMWEQYRNPLSSHNHVIMMNLKEGWGDNTPRDFCGYTIRNGNPALSRCYINHHYTLSNASVEKLRLVKVQHQSKIKITWKQKSS